MKLGDIIAGKSGGAFKAPTKTVRFKVIGKDQQAGNQVVADAECELAFVPEDERTDAFVQAEKAIRKQYPDGGAPASLLGDERVFYLLQRAMRDSDDVRQPFAGSVAQLKQSLHFRTAIQINDAYEKFCADEFPEQVDDATLAALIEEAEKKSLAALLSAYGSSTIRRALPSLEGRYGQFQTGTSGAG